MREGLTPGAVLDKITSHWALSGAVDKHRLWSGLLVTLGVGATVGLDRAPGGWALWLSIVATIVVSGGVWIIGESRAASIRTASESARSETLLDLGHLLEPLSRELGRVAALPARQRQRERGSLRQAVINAASGLSPRKLRANYFELQLDRQSMLCAASTGRAGQPAAGFHAGVRSGDAALQMVLTGGHLFCENVEEFPPSGWEPSSHAEYKTFISVTVGTPGKPSGMLTLDAPEPGDLTDEDVKMLLVLGHMLGIAEELTS